MIWVHFQGHRNIPVRQTKHQMNSACVSHTKLKQSNKTCYIDQASFELANQLQRWSSMPVNRRENNNNTAVSNRKIIQRLNHKNPGSNLNLTHLKYYKYEKQSYLQWPLLFPSQKCILS